MSVKYNKHDIIIRKAKREDMIELCSMVHELAASQNMASGPRLTAEDLERDCFDLQPPAFQCKIAEETNSGQLLGHAVYFYTYSTWEGRSLFLQNLCVKERYRRRGIGEMLLDAIAKEAAQIGNRLDFHVLDWNPARKFYEAKGSENLTEKEGWLYYRLSGDKLKELANKL